MLAAFAAQLQAQQALLADGADADDCRLCVVEFQEGGVASLVLRSSVKLLDVHVTGELANEPTESQRPRRLVQRGISRIEASGGARLFAFENNQQQEFGLLHVAGDGTARIVHTSTQALDAPLAMAGDARHVAFARGAELVLVRLDGGTYPSTGTNWRSIGLGDNVDRDSVVVGATFAACVLDDGSVHRVALADGAVAVDVTPPAAVGTFQPKRLAIAANGGAVAFLRGQASDQLHVFVLRANGPALQLAGPPRAYRAPDPLPGGLGEANLVLSDDGEQLLAIEAGVEDELHVFDTVANATAHLTGPQLFADYIGAHVLPRFVANDLVFASGHLGEFDWFRARADIGVVNLTQTGAPEPPFLVGSLAVRQRTTLGNGALLASDGDGPVTLRKLPLVGAASVLFADLLAEPTVGSSVVGAPDLLVRGVGGDRLVSGVDGGVLLALPPGLSLSPPVRAAQGVVVTYASLPQGIGVLGLVLPDGSAIAGPLHASPPQFACDAAGHLVVLDGATLHLLAPFVHRTAGLEPRPWRCLLSGSGS